MTDIVLINSQDILVIEHADGTVDIVEVGSQGPAGPSGYAYTPLVNDEATALVIGCPIYCDAAGKVKRAKGDALATSQVIGLVRDATIAAAAQGGVLTSGTLMATTAQWDVVTGGSGGLTYGTFYFLSQTTAGRITATPTTTAGLYITPLGEALSPTQLLVRIGQPILQ